MVNRRFGKKMKGSSEKKKVKGFVYKPRTAAQVRERAERSLGKFDTIFKQGVDTYQMKTGTHVARILPPTWDDHSHFGLTVWVHAYIGPDGSSYICPYKTFNKPCAACEAAADAKKQGEAEEAKQLEVRERILTYVLDRNEDDNIPRVWNMSASQDKEISGLCQDPRSGEAIEVDNPESGFDLTFKRSGKGLHTKYTSYQFDREESAISDDGDTYDEIMNHIMENPLPSLLVYATNKKIAAAIAGVGEEADPDEDEEDEAPRGKGKPKRRPEPEEDEEEDEPPPRKKRRPEPEDEDEEEPPPRKAAKRRPEPEEDEAEDEEDEEEPPPRKKPAARVQRRR